MDGFGKEAGTGGGVDFEGREHGEHELACLLAFGAADGLAIAQEAVLLAFGPGDGVGFEDLDLQNIGLTGCGGRGSPSRDSCII